MKVLALIILFTISCTDNKKEQEQENIKNISTHIISQETNMPPKPIELSYDKGLDLILIDSDFNSTISTILQGFDTGLEYYAVYWGSNNNQYYTIENDIALLYPIPVTNTNFVYTIDETKQFESVFDPSLKEIFPDTKAPLLYLGSVSPLERVYLDPTNQLYYIKKLKIFDTSFHIDYDNNDNPITNIIDSPVFPILISNISSYYDYDLQVTNNELVIISYLTNTNDQIFSITEEYNNDFHLYYSSYINDLD